MTGGAPACVEAVESASSEVCRVSKPAIGDSRGAGLGGEMRAGLRRPPVATAHAAGRS